MFQLSYDLTWQKLKEKFSHCGMFFSPAPHNSFSLKYLCPKLSNLTATVALRYFVFCAALFAARYHLLQAKCSLPRSRWRTAGRRAAGRWGSTVQRAPTTRAGSWMEPRSTAGRWTSASIATLKTSGRLSLTHFLIQPLRRWSLVLFCFKNTIASYLLVFTCFSSILFVYMRNSSYLCFVRHFEFVKQINE